MKTGELIRKFRKENNWTQKNLLKNLVLQR